MIAEPLGRRSAIAGWASSIAIHAAIAWLATVALEPPDTGFELQVPEEIELGLIEASEVEEPAPVPEPAEAAEASSEPSEQGSGQARARPDAGPPADAQRRRRDAQPDAGPMIAGLGTGPPLAFLPAGAQLALRIDMDRIRSSPLGQDVRELLAVMPDWQGLLAGSELDPVRDVSRLLIATPNLDRSRMVYAGRLSAEAGAPRAIVEAFARARGAEAHWSERGGIPRTEWPGPDGIARDVALIGDRHFVIARGEDLPRVLAIAAARRGRRAPASGAPAPTSAADALLSMEEAEGLSIEIENVAAFVRRSPPGLALPERMRLAMIEREDGVEVRALASFARAEDAEPARAWLEHQIEILSGNLVVALYGLAGPIERIDLGTEAHTLRAETRLRYSELRTIFGLLRGLFDRRPGPTTRTPPPMPPPEPPPSPFE